MDRVGRIFVAVEIPDEVRHSLVHSINGIGNSLPGRPVPPENWHITLRFLGDTELLTFEKMLAALSQALADHSPFSLCLGRLGAFPKPSRATVLWVGVTGAVDNLMDLAEEVEEVCATVGIPPEERPFHPHLTLARIRPHQNVAKLLETSRLEQARFDVSHVSVYRSILSSGGAHYEILERIDLSL